MNIIHILTVVLLTLLMFVPGFLGNHKQGLLQIHFHSIFFYNFVRILFTMKVRVYCILWKKLLA
jgi:hypothetical protein